MVCASYVVHHLMSTFFIFFSQGTCKKRTLFVRMVQVEWQRTHTGGAQARTYINIVLLWLIGNMPIKVHNVVLYTLVVHNIALYWLDGAQDDFACSLSTFFWWCTMQCCQSQCPLSTCPFVCPRTNVTVQCLITRGYMIVSTVKSQIESPGRYAMVWGGYNRVKYKTVTQSNIFYLIFFLFLICKMVV